MVVAVSRQVPKVLVPLRGVGLCANQDVGMPGFVHIPVLLDEVISAARMGREGVIVDCTVGGGGHARALLEAFPKATLVGLDRDPAAVQAARANLASFGGRAQVAQAKFSDLEATLDSLGVKGVDVLLADFGVSSHQLDTAGRGFSFRDTGALDMRMNPDEGMSAAEVLETLDADALGRAIHTFGEERFARRVARNIVARKPRTTEALAHVVRQSVPASKDGIDPATRTFQAIRMLVNDEMPEIVRWLQAVPNVLNDGGVGLAISFHSLEDRAVKQAWRLASRDCVCPPGLPVCACTHRAVLQVPHRKGWVASEEERRRNPRSRSARLRAAVRLGRAP